MTGLSLTKTVAGVDHVVLACALYGRYDTRLCTVLYKEQSLTVTGLHCIYCTVLTPILHVSAAAHDDAGVSCTPRPVAAFENVRAWAVDSALGVGAGEAGAVSSRACRSPSSFQRLPCVRNPFRNVGHQAQGSRRRLDNNANQALHHALARSCETLLLEALDQLEEKTSDAASHALAQAVNAFRDVVVQVLRPACQDDLLTNNYLAPMPNRSVARRTNRRA